MDPKPLNNFTLAASGNENSGPKKGLSTPVDLNLGIGTGSAGPRSVKSTFTPAQLHELQQQSLVLKYIVAGLHVPFDLVLPIWKTVSRSFGAVNGGIYNQYPSLIGFSEQESYYRRRMDPEPGRCRRTDGKKWRCSREVIPNQKYCDRHMHRGCRRSRKHVEAPTTTTTTTTTTTSSAIDVSDKNVAAKDDSTPTITTTATTTTTTTKDESTPTITTTATATTGIANAAAGNNRAVNNCNDGNSLAPEVGVSTGSVLRAVETKLHRCRRTDSEGSRCNTEVVPNHKYCARHSHTDANKLAVASQPVTVATSPPPQATPPLPAPTSLISPPLATLRRCRRTDGRKWRCGWEVLPDHEYCERHFRRGAKKLAVVAVPPPPPPPSNVFLSPPLAIPKEAEGPLNLDINLTISIAASSRETSNGEAASSSSSDATTITDENGSVS